MLIDYTVLRASRPLGRDCFPRWVLDHDVDVALERGQLTPREAAAATCDPAIMALAPTMPTRAIAARLADGGDESRWADSAIGADATRFDGAGVVVAVLDGGIDRMHSTFGDVALVIRDFTGTEERGDRGSGTSLASRFFGGDVAGRRVGVARGVRRALVGQVLDATGAGTTDDLYEAFLWAARGGARVIAMALELDIAAAIAARMAAGWSPAAATMTALAHYHANTRALDLLTLLANATTFSETGALVIAAAGDDSLRGATAPRIAHAAPASAPASSTGALAIGAVATHPAGLIVAPFSNLYPRLCAPGVGISAARDGGGVSAATGTAMAAASAAGVAALWCEHLGPTARASHVAAQVRASARLGVFAAAPDPADVGAGLVTAPR
jgi:subtilisin family serine protease